MRAWRLSKAFYLLAGGMRRHHGGMNTIATIIRVFATFIGLVVILMWLAGCLGLADFRLIFLVPERP